VTTLPLFSEHEAQGDDTPLPLLVAKKWNFPLAFHIVEGKYMYAIQDWVRGLVGEDDIRHLWSKFKRENPSIETLSSRSRLPYKATDGKIYQRDYVNDAGLYLIAQHLRVTRARPVLNEIREFLAKAGVFIDDMRRDEDLIVISSKMSADQMLDATGKAALLTRKAYRAQGKSEKWIDMRLLSKVRREQFTAALGLAISEVLKRKHYATATDDIYKGLWGRTAAYLKKELALPKGSSLRDHQTIYALHFQGLAEEACADKLGERNSLSWIEAREIIKFVAAMIGRYTKEMSEFLGKDLATGYPLLRQG
jgi:hypothetical protein